MGGRSELPRGKIWGRGDDDQRGLWKIRGEEKVSLWAIKEIQVN